MSMIRQLIGIGCLSAALWLCANHFAADGSVVANPGDNIVQGTKVGYVESIQPGAGRPPINAAGVKNAGDTAAGQLPLPGPAAPPLATTAGVEGSPVIQEAQPIDPPGYMYRAEGRRDPFLAIVQDANKAVEVNLNVPPLQRVALSEITLIGIVWGGFGYLAMVQTPDGRGYTVREGTRIGSSEGLVSAITAEVLSVKEPAIDVLGKKEMREHVIPLHQKVNIE